MGRDAYEELVSFIHDPTVVHGMVEDYRAGVRIDHRHDLDDRNAGRKVRCPMLCLGRKTMTWSRSRAIRSQSGTTAPTT